MVSILPQAPVESFRSAFRSSAAQRSYKDLWAGQEIALNRGQNTVARAMLFIDAAFERQRLPDLS